MSSDWQPPPFPDDVVTSWHDGPCGRMRSRSVGRPVEGMPEIALVQGLAVADYLLPALGALGEWTRAHLLDLPGLAGSGDPPHELSIEEYGAAVRDWIDAQGRRFVVAGHSSGTQVASEAAAGNPAATGLVLASPTTDPLVRGPLRLTVAWQLDGRREPPGLTGSHVPEWRRAGPRRLWHLVGAQLRHDIEQPVSRTSVPVLVIRGRRDLISRRRWARHLAGLVDDGAYVEVDGAHTFVWLDPGAWSAPIRSFAESCGR